MDFDQVCNEFERCVHHPSQDRPSGKDLPSSNYCNSKCSVSQKKWGFDKQPPPAKQNRLNLPWWAHHKWIPFKNKICSIAVSTTPLAKTSRPSGTPNVAGKRFRSSAKESSAASSVAAWGRKVEFIVASVKSLWCLSPFLRNGHLWSFMTVWHSFRIIFLYLGTACQSLLKRDLHPCKVTCIPPNSLTESHIADEVWPVCEEPTWKSSQSSEKETSGRKSPLNLGEAL